VRDAVAHLVGIASDLNAQRFDVTDPGEWTARQVHERQHAALALDVVAGTTVRSRRLSSERSVAMSRRRRR
jgi:hypothetical protein